MEKEDELTYPRGILLFNHICVRPRLLLIRTSEMAIVFSLKETGVRTQSSSSPDLWSSTLDAEQSLFSEVLCLLSSNGLIGLIGDGGEQVSDSTVGEVSEDGASNVNVKSSFVKFDAWRVKTWP